MADANPYDSLKVDLAGQIAVVTGAFTGPRQGDCRRARRSRQGRVHRAQRRCGKPATTVAEITAAGGQAEVFPCDVRESAAVDKLMNDINEKWPHRHRREQRGYHRDTLLPMMSDDDWDNVVIATNLRGPFLFARAVSRLMMRQR